MVRRIQYVLIDDIDGSPAVETVCFGVGDTRYELELNRTHLEQFHASMQRWIRHARIVDGPSVAESSQKTPSRDGDGPEIRRWAALRGIPVAARGRIPAALRQQYYAERVGPGAGEA